MREATGRLYGEKTLDAGPLNRAFGLAATAQLCESFRGYMRVFSSLNVACGADLRLIACGILRRSFSDIPRR
jgi:hypothetical protein